MKKILITGMSGLIGGILRSHLETLGNYELSALNRRPVEGIRCLQANIADLNRIRPAFRDIDVVVHLAAHVSAKPWESMLSTNLIGTRNVYEAARLEGVRRVVFASSGATVKGFEDASPYSDIVEGCYDELPNRLPKLTHEMATRPVDLYGASKVWGEALGRHYAHEYDLSVLCVRIGAVGKDNRPSGARARSVYLSHRDVADILHRCIEAPTGLKFDIFFATSRNQWGFRDLEHPSRTLGFVPSDSAEGAI